MRHRLFAVVSVISLLLCLATVVLWVRSLWVYDAGPFTEGRNAVQIDSLNGEFAVTLHWHPGSHDPAALRVWIIDGDTETTRLRSYRQHFYDDLELLWENQYEPRYLHVSIAHPPQGRTFVYRLVRLDGMEMSRNSSLRSRAFLGIGMGGETLSFQSFTRPPVDYRFITFLCPYWAATAITSLLPVGWLLVHWRQESLRRSRLMEGVCPTCRYSLIGNTSGVCPECGTLDPKVAAGQSGVIDARLP